MYTLHETLLALHIGIGTVAIFVFWLPVLARKGSPLHVRAGRIYTWTMYAVVFSALAMCLMVLFDPIGAGSPARNLDMETALRNAQRSRMFALFLLMLSLLVLSGLRHGLLALQARHDPAALRRPGHLVLISTLGLVGIAVGITGFQYQQILLMVFAVISLSASISMLREARQPRLSPKQALIAHFNGLIGTGIGAYTALFAFGGSRLLAEFLQGQWQVLAWITPAVIGTIAIRRTARRYQGRVEA